MEEYISGAHSDLESQSKIKGKMASQEIVYQFEDIGATEKKMITNSGF